MLNIRAVLYVDGLLLLVLAAAMAVPIAVDLSTGGGEWASFSISLALTGFAGLALVLSSRGSPPGSGFRGREAFLVAVLGAVLCGVCGALPMLSGGLRLSFSDAFFESVSGITTTGATVLTDLDLAPRAVLIWRAMLEWLGGIGILYAGTTIMPVLSIGGRDAFDGQVLASADSLRPRRTRAARTMVTMYAAITAALALGFKATGMSALEATCHAMSALSTGGFSTSDQSLGHFGEGARWVCILGMILGATSFRLFLPPWRRGAILRDTQLRWFLAVIVFFSLLLAAWNWTARGLPAGEALRRSAFDAAAVLTTSGFHTDDYTSWGTFPGIAFFIMAFIGGCTGSTAGGVKVFRYEALFALTGVRLRRLLRPHAVFAIAVGGRPLSSGAVRSVVSFVMLYFLCVGALGLALSLTGLDAVTSLSGAAAAMANLGPGLGHIIGPGGSYHDLPQAAKWLLDFGMVLGRLELAAVLVLFTPAFWQG